MNCRFSAFKPPYFKTGAGLLLITMGIGKLRAHFQLMPKSATFGWPLIDLEWPLCILLHFLCFFFRVNHKNLNEVDPYYRRQKCSPGILVDKSWLEKANVNTPKCLSRLEWMSMKLIWNQYKDQGVFVQIREGLFSACLLGRGCSLSTLMYLILVMGRYQFLKLTECWYF